MEEQLFDAIIIGTGQAGLPLASFLTGKGWKVAIVEKSFVGGTCINYGCTPTKTMIASARVAHLNQRSADFGISHTPIQIDLTTIVNRKNEVVLHSRAGSEKRLKSDDLITLLYGTASFESAEIIRIHAEDGKEQLLKAPKIFINTGAANHTPALKGIETVTHLDSTSIMNLTQLPEHLIILGGSYIAVEFGQLFSRLGSRVTIIERGTHILQHEDEDVSGELKSILEKEGIQFYLQSEITEVRKGDNEKSVVVIHKSGKNEFITGSHLLVALGRVPQTSELQLHKAGVKTGEKGDVLVNEFLETNVPGIYALGDVNGGPAFTHIAYDDYRIVSHNLFNTDKKSTKDRVVPYCVFTDPELGRTGITEKEARQKKLNIKIARLPMAHVARAIESGETAGFMKAVVDADTEEILGASVLGVYGGEISSVLNLAILGKLKYTLIRDGIFAHPTFSESLNNLFTSFEEDK